jgi:hypothetical protein
MSKNSAPNPTPTPAQVNQLHSILLLELNSEKQILCVCLSNGAVSAII